MWTHEYWVCKDMTEGNYSGLWIDDRNDGGSKQDKYTRDVKILTAQLEVETRLDLISRCYFYRGQSYSYLAQSSGDEYHDMYYQLAISDLKHCARTHFSLDYRCDAMMKIASCYKAMGDDKTALAYYHEVSILMPGNAEPLYEIGMLYKNRMFSITSDDLLDQYSKTTYCRQALNYLHKASLIPLPVNHALWVKYNLYDYIIETEVVTMAAWNTNHDMKHLGKEAAISLASKCDKMPASDREYLYNMVLEYYQMDIRPLMEKVVDINF